MINPVNITPCEQTYGPTSEKTLRRKSVLSSSSSAAAATPAKGRKASKRRRYFGLSMISLIATIIVSRKMYGTMFRGGMMFRCVRENSHEYQL